MQEPVNTHKSELWTLSLRDLFYKYVRFLPVFILSVALALLVAYAYLRYTTRVYSATGTLLIKAQQQQGPSDKFEDMFLGNRSLNMASEIEILKSRPLMERVVKKLNLQVSYYSKGRFITNNIYKLGPFIFDIAELADSSKSFTLNVKFLNNQEFRVNNEAATYRFGQYFNNAHGMFRLVSNPISQIGKDYIVNYQPSFAAAGLAGGVQVTPKTANTGILNISFVGTNPVMCADIVNQLMEEYKQYSIEARNSSSELILAFIDIQLDYFGNQLDSIQRKLLTYQQDNNLIDIGAQTGEYFGRISDADRRINEQQMQLNVAEYIDEYLKDKKNEYNRVVTPSALNLQDATLNTMVGSYNGAQLERKALIDGNVPPDNPRVKELDGQIEKLRLNIQETLRNLKSNFTATINDLRKRSSSALSGIKTIPGKNMEFLRIKRQEETMLGLYKILQEKKIETSISKASTISNSETIDRAGVNPYPIKPNKKTIRIMAIVLGLALPAMFIFISEVLNDKISTRFDIEKITPAPILGEIGHSYSKNALIVTKTTRSMVAEQFRIIRSNLQYILNKVEKSVILVTSSFSGEGKSFVTTNMGAVIALTGKKTIMLEFDIRKPKILSGLGMSKRPGISNYLVGKAKIEDLIAPVPDQQNLYILACGPIPPNPSELLLDQRVAELFAYLRQHFDVVLVDTAPVGMVSDAQTLGKFADCTLYLVRQGHTFKKQVALIDEFYQENKLPKVSIVINDVKIKPGYGYYGYGRYGYGYGYGYGGYYEEETPPRSYFERIFGWLDIRRLFMRSRRR